MFRAFLTHKLLGPEVAHAGIKELLPRRWVAEQSFAWSTRFRRLVRDYERLPQALVGLHYSARELSNN